MDPDDQRLEGEQVYFAKGAGADSIDRKPENLQTEGIITTFNAASLGAAFGYMARADVAAGETFFEFVRAHGPFELTAIVLSAGAGLRLAAAGLASRRA